ncbi:MAG: TraR/DksA C4-type zinc finger protein [Microthrixaceae bacterium]|nr:TraR/DksA C4-type zinc finger protein [Microthrixaceae bacterium]
MTTTAETQRSYVLEASARELADHRAELRSTLDRRRRDAETASTSATDGHGETEHLAIAEQLDNDARLDAMTRAALADVEAALRRVELGTYGICVECGEQIPEERLELLPATPMCIRCQTRVEQA